MLTRKQRELLLFINRRLQTDGISPSFDEMKEALDLKSKSGIHRLITALEERGFIHRLANRARALEVLKMPEGSAEELPDDEVEETALPEPAAMAATTVKLPLYGRIAAGLPIEALNAPQRYTDIPMHLVGKGEHYALEIAGDSMIEAGILDGDTVIIRRCETADNGTIVVALVDNAEATLKRLRRHGPRVALEPANATYEIRDYPANRVQVQGKLVGLIRAYD